MLMGEKKNILSHTIWMHYDDKMMYACEKSMQNNEQKFRFFFLPKFHLSMLKKKIRVFGEMLLGGPPAPARGGLEALSTPWVAVGPGGWTPTVWTPPGRGTLKLEPSVESPQAPAQAMSKWPN